MPTRFLDDDVLALVHCYADASNLQTVKERLEVRVRVRVRVRVTANRGKRYLRYLSGVEGNRALTRTLDTHTHTLTHSLTHSPTP